MNPTLKQTLVKGGALAFCLLLTAGLWSCAVKRFVKGMQQAMKDSTRRGSIPCFYICITINNSDCFRRVDFKCIGGISV